MISEEELDVEQSADQGLALAQLRSLLSLWPVCRELSHLILLSEQCH